jgi:hypothetical protein
MLTLLSVRSSDQNVVFDNRLCSRDQPTAVAVAFKGSPGFQLRIIIVGPGLRTLGSTANVADPSRQAMLRVSVWVSGQKEPSVPLLECGVSLGEIFKMAAMGIEGRQVWVGVTSTTGGSVNRHLVREASVRCEFLFQPFPVWF